MENLLTGLDDNKRDVIIKDVLNKFNLSRDYYHEKHELFRRLYKEYRAQREDATTNSDWSIKIALGYGLVENIVSRVVDTVLGKLSVEVKPKRNDHLRKSENFYNMCRTYFGEADYRTEFTEGTRERVITGTQWEFGDWVSEYADGFRWATTRMEKVANMEIPVVSAVARVARKIAFKGYKLISHKFPIAVGYRTRFPSIFNIFPQPGIIRVKDLKWIIEEVPYKAISDLEKCIYQDEADKPVQVYDLSKIKELQERKISLVPTFPDDKDTLETFRQELESIGTGKGGATNDGIDAVHLLILRNEREQIVIANGSWLIQHVKDIYHKPGLKVRARYYTPSNHSIYGIGALEPVIDSLNEFSDVHSLAMQDWFRSVNQMVAVVEDSFPYPEDFDSRSGGYLRAGPNTDLTRAIMPVAKRDNVSSMITAQSGIQGLVENIVSVAEMTPGPMGTRPYHSTFGGMQEIQSSMAKRFRLMMNIDQCETMKQMDEMYWMYDQFMFDDMPFKKFDNGIGAVSYKREDIDTDGEGFLFVISDDPSFGDSQTQRNLAMVLFNTSMTYADFQLRHPDQDKCNVGEIFKWVLEMFGKGDSTKILVPADGSMDPDSEYELMLQGVPVQVNAKENLTWHLIKHLMQKDMLEKNQDQNPVLATTLINHIMKTKTAIEDISMNPEQYAQQYLQEEAIKQQEKPQNHPTGGQLNMGQNIPAVSGAQ